MCQTGLSSGSRLILAALFAATAAPSRAQVYEFTTLAGRSTYLSADGFAAEFQLQRPGGVAVDREGNVYVADTSNEVIRKLSNRGVASILAGAILARGSADGTGAYARFNDPRGIAVDDRGNVFVADTENSTIRKVTADGVVTTIAGTAGTTDSTDGPAATAHFYRPYALAFDHAGNLFILDRLGIGSDTIRKLAPDLMVSTVTGVAGSFVAGPGNPLVVRHDALAVDADGNLLISETRAEEINYMSRGWTEKTTGSAVLKLGRDGGVATVAGSAVAAGTGDGVGAAARFGRIWGLAVASDGSVLVTDGTALRRIAADGAVRTIAGDPNQGFSAQSQSADGVGLNARFNQLRAIAVDGAGSAFVVDSYLGANGADTIRKVSPEVVVTTVAGSADATLYRDGAGQLARFNSPLGVAVDASGNVFVADSGNRAIRRITPAGVVSTVPIVDGRASSPGTLPIISSPAAVAVDANGTLFVCDGGLITKVARSGVASVLAGSIFIGQADGIGDAARFFSPAGVAVDGNGDVFVADLGNRVIRKIAAGGIVTTFAGSIGNPGSSDGPGSAARFAEPQDVAVDQLGNVFVADDGTIRKITQGGVVTTLAGSAGQHGSVDGLGAAARFAGPLGLAVDRSGNLFVADGNTIRKVTPAGLVTTIGGKANAVGNGDGTGSAARFGQATAIAVDAAGNLYVADFWTNSIRKGTPLANPGRLANVSVLARLTDSNDTVTVGTIIGGAGTTGTKPLLVRAAGPSLAPFGVTGVLEDPRLAFFTGTTQVGQNDDWGGASDLTAAFAQVSAFPFTTSASKDAALFLRATPRGNNTVRITGAGGGGAVLVELYDTGSVTALPEDTPRLLNVSVLKKLGDGLTVGFIVGGTSSMTVLVRAAGPSLTSFGVAGALADPRIEVFDGRQRSIARNDDWSEPGELATTELTSTFAAVGAFPFATSDSKDSALALTLAPGNYTVQVSGATGTDGMVLLEVYEVR